MNPSRRIRSVVPTILAAAFLCAATPSLPADTATAPDAVQTPVRKSAISPRRSAVVEANEAERRLKMARLAREQGAEPMPGERIRGAGAVNQRYWQRQDKLRREAEQALRRSNETRRPVHASR